MQPPSGGGAAAAARTATEWAGKSAELERYQLDKQLPRLEALVQTAGAGMKEAEQLGERVREWQTQPASHIPTPARRHGLSLAQWRQRIAF